MVVRNKERLVAKGFAQVEGLDFEKFAPVTRLLVLLKYPFYPLFILDNGINLISKSLTVLTPA